MRRIQKSRLMAIILAAVIAVSALAIGLGSTLAAKNDIVEDFKQPNTYETLEKNTPFDRGVSGGARTSSSDTSVATATLDIGKGDVTITGLKAGVATIVTGSSAGLLLRWPYQITDSSLLTGYRIKNGAEVYLAPSSPGKTFSLTDGFVTTTPASALSTIEWRSLQPTIADVDKQTGLITAKPNARGVAIILGEFTDKWGVQRDLHILVGVGVNLGGSGNSNQPNLGNLMEWIAKGEAILGLPDNPYTTGSLQDLLDAVNGGKDVINMADPSDQVIKNAVDAIKDAINNLKQKPHRPGGIFGPDDNGDYFTPVGDPPHVYEVVDKDGNSKQPPQFIWDDNKDGDNNPATGGNNHPAIPGDGNNSGFYYVEDPEGSNIWKPVDKDGKLDDNNAFWGGGNGRPGGGDDKNVGKFGNTWWVSRGQNVWQQVNPNGNNNKELGPLTGGGPDLNPTTDGVRPIFPANNNGEPFGDGKYYIGPINPGPDQYYIGDKPAGQGGDGKLNSSTTVVEDSDCIYWLVDGQMTTTPPTPPPGSVPIVTGNDSRTLDTNHTGDTVDWIEIARYGQYSLIVRKSYIHISNGHNGDPSFQTYYFGTSNAYASSYVRTKINDWFTGTAQYGDKLALDARLRKYTMQNDAKTVVGTGAKPSSMSDGFSKPVTPATQIGNNDDVAFALSYSEAATFCSNSHDIFGANPQVQPSSNEAKANFAKLSVPSVTNNSRDYEVWLRSPSNPGTAAVLSGNTTGIGSNLGRVFQDGTDIAGLTQPALWVKQTIFNDPVQEQSQIDIGKASPGDAVTIDGKQWNVVQKDGDYAMLIIKGNDYGSGTYNNGNSAKTYGDTVQQAKMDGFYADTTEMKKIAVVPYLNKTCQSSQHVIPFPQCSAAESWYAKPDGTMQMAGSKTTGIFFAPSFEDVGRSNRKPYYKGTKLAFWTRSHAEIGMGTTEEMAKYFDSYSNTCQATATSETFTYAPCVWVKYK